MEREREREARLERGTQRVERGVRSGESSRVWRARRELEREGREGSCKHGVAWPLVRGRERVRWVEEDGSSVMEASVWLVAVRRPAPLLRYLTALLSVSKAASTDGSSRDPLVSSSSSPRSDPTITSPIRSGTESGIRLIVRGIHPDVSWPIGNGSCACREYTVSEGKRRVNEEERYIYI